MVASLCAAESRCKSIISSRVSSEVAQKSASAGASSANQGRVGPLSRPKTSPKYPSSTLATCLTRPSRLVPVGVSGRRASYSLSPSSFAQLGTPGAQVAVQNRLVIHGGDHTEHRPTPAVFTRRRRAAGCRSRRPGPGARGCPSVQLRCAGNCSSQGYWPRAVCEPPQSPVAPP
jgi:hypothetical protein